MYRRNFLMIKRMPTGQCFINITGAQAVSTAKWFETSFYAGAEERASDVEINPLGAQKIAYGIVFFCQAYTKTYTFCLPW